MATISDRLALTASFQDKGNPGVVTVVPGCFDQEQAYENVAGLGDEAAVLRPPEENSEGTRPK